MIDEISQLKLLAGVANKPNWTTYYGYPGSNISVTANEKAELMREHNIKPGTEAWFKLWFSKPYLTSESPI